MELIVFDLDGTLLNQDSVISDFSRETLNLLTQAGIAYTIATGRTLHSSREVLEGHGFGLPQIYKNGVVIWHPQTASFSHRTVLTPGELGQLHQVCLDRDVTPFVFTLESDDQHAVYHSPLRSQAEEDLVRLYLEKRGLKISPIEQLPGFVDVLNVSAIGPQTAIEGIAAFAEGQDKLVAYSGPAMEGKNLYWIDVHHGNASKGNALEVLKGLLSIESIICFGDSDNDMSMFAMADECYAPANAKPHVREAASAVIGHHHEEGIARFLRERFNLT